MRSLFLTLVLAVAAAAPLYGQTTTTSTSPAGNGRWVIVNVLWELYP